MAHTLHLALTGNIAAGKSTVAALLADHGATIIDADLLAREAVAPGSPGLAAVIAQFGTALLRPDGTLDRAALRQRVFADASAREALNAIVHPEVRRRRDAAVQAAVARGDQIIISDIPLLFEVGLEGEFDGVILVDAAPEVRLARLVGERGLSAEEARRMIDAQWPSDRKRQGATWIIDNNGPRDALVARVGEVWDAIRRTRG
jgi:dephospho-CoA kinase